MYHMDADKTYKDKARRKECKNASIYIEQFLELSSHETTVIRLLYIHNDRTYMDGGGTTTFLYKNIYVF